MWTFRCQAGFRKGRGTRDQIANILWVIKNRVPEKYVLLLYCLCQSLCVDHNKLGKILQDMGTDYLPWLLRNLYVGQEETVRTGHGTTDWFQIGKGVGQGWILSPCLFNLYAAKSLQSCLTLCDPRDGSPPGSPVPGILQARTHGVGCHFLLQCMKVKSEREVA